MRFKQFTVIYDWCFTLYIVTFGPEDGFRRFSKLTLIEAFALWEAGGGNPLPSLLN